MVVDDVVHDLVVVLEPEFAERAVADDLGFHALVVAPPGVRRKRYYAAWWRPRETRPPMDLRSMLQLEPHGPDTYVGVGPRYPWGGLYGGQIVAQGLRAAAATVEPAFRVHSLHAYFIRRGDHTEPIRFEVDRLRNGRSFVTRAVVARQSTGAILNMSASFQVDEGGTDLDAADPPPVPGPDTVEDDTWTPWFDRRMVWPVRDTHPGEVASWFSPNGSELDDPVLRACALAYVSDDLPTDAVRSRHHASADDAWSWDDYTGASLDHAIWFHRPVPSERWQLHHFRCAGLLSSRGLAVGRVFGQDGTHVATVTQEVLLRRRRVS
jgi:acyl-CoA thioesterase-2